MKPVETEYTLDISALQEPIDVMLRVNYFHETKPNRSCRDSDWDYYGHIEVDFDIVVDGKVSRELWDKLTPKELEAIEIAITEEMSEEA
jgi:hypothetical protein